MATSLWLPLPVSSLIRMFGLNLTAVAVGGPSDRASAAELPRSAAASVPLPPVPFAPPAPLAGASRRASAAASAPAVPPPPEPPADAPPSPPDPAASVPPVALSEPELHDSVAPVRRKAAPARRPTRRGARL
jgi:hypothetical protein